MKQFKLDSFPQFHFPGAFLTGARVNFEAEILKLMQVKILGPQDTKTLKFVKTMSKSVKIKNVQNVKYDIYLISRYKI